MRHRFLTNAACWLAAAVCLFGAGRLDAAGLTYLDPGPLSLGRAGAVTAGVDDASAAFLNPARLTALGSVDILFGVSAVDLRQSFARAGVDSQGAPYGAVEQSGPLGWLPLVAVAFDAGLDDWAFAVSAHAPNAYGTRRFPERGAQRYALVETDLMLAFLGASVAWEPVPGLSFGLTLELVTTPKAEVSMVVDGYWLGTTHPDFGPYDTLARVDVSDPARFTATAGVSWRATPWLDVAASARILPVRISADGTFRPSFDGEAIGALYDSGDLSVTDNGVHLKLTLPPVVRFALRVHEPLPAAPVEKVRADRPRWDLELDAVWELWSLYERLDVSFDGALRLEYASQDLPLHELDMARNYQDTVSLRLGGSFQPGPDWLRLHAGGYWESAAAPAATTTVDAASSHRLGFGLGAAVAFWKMEATLSYLHVFELDVTGGDDIHQQRPASACAPPYDDPEYCDPIGEPTGPVVGAGRYESSVSFVSLGLRLVL